MNILISAYAVSPNHGSEPGVGWNWITQIAKYCKVFVITEAEFKDDIEEALDELPQQANIKFYFNDIGEKARDMCWNQGDYRFYYYYRQWQKKTFEIAITVTTTYKIDVVHQLNMIGYREPGFLWQLENIPFVWGPVGGFNFVKPSFLLSLGWSKAFFYITKNFVNYLQALTSTRVKKAVNHADLLLAASGNTQTALKKFYKKESVLLNETGCHLPIKRKGNSSHIGKQVFNILWVGRFIPTKLLGLALEVIEQVKDLEGLTFYIVGDGTRETALKEWREYSVKLGIDHLCQWHGKIPHEKVDEIMKKSDLLLFTSIVEGTSHVVLESISNALPILCFNTCGHGEIVTPEIGLKIPVEDPQKSKIKFAQAIKELHLDRKLLKQMSVNCEQKIVDLSWEEKGKKMFSYYQTL